MDGEPVSINDEMDGNNFDDSANVKEPVFVRSEAQELFRRSAIIQMCRKHTTISHLNFDVYTTAQLLELLDCARKQVSMEFPILGSKMAIKSVLRYIVKRYPHIKTYLNPDNIRITVEPDESVCLLSNDKRPSLFSSHIGVVVLKNIMINMLGNSLDNLSSLTKMFGDINPDIIAENQQQQQPQSSQSETPNSQTPTPSLSTSTLNLQGGGTNFPTNIHGSGTITIKTPTPSDTASNKSDGSNNSQFRPPSVMTNTFLNPMGNNYSVDVFRNPTITSLRGDIDVPEADEDNNDNDSIISDFDDQSVFSETQSVRLSAEDAKHSSPTLSVNDLFRKLEKSQNNESVNSTVQNDTEPVVRIDTSIVPETNIERSPSSISSISTIRSKRSFVGNIEGSLVKPSSPTPSAFVKIDKPKTPSITSEGCDDEVRQILDGQNDSDNRSIATNSDYENNNVTKHTVDLHAHETLPSSRSVSRNSSIRSNSILSDSFSVDRSSSNIFNRFKSPVNFTNTIPKNGSVKPTIISNIRVTNSKDLEFLNDIDNFKKQFGQTVNKKVNGVVKKKHNPLLID